MVVYAFDMDDTLEVSNGPVKLADLGNILVISGASDDRGAAERAGWRFIKEGEFAKGLR